MAMVMELSLIVFLLTDLVSGQYQTLIATSTLKYDLVSPGYESGRDYSTNLRYDYLVTATNADLTLTLTVVDCQFEQLPSYCPWDHLFIYDGPNANSTLLVDFCCQNETRPTYTTTGNQAYLLFSTDGSNGGRGFKMSYVSTGGTTVNPTKTILTTTTTHTTTTSPATTKTHTTTPKPTKYQVTTIPHTSPEHSPITGCHNGWLVFEVYCYLFGSDAIRFVEAEHYCRQHGGHLVEIFSSLENSFVKDELKKLGPKCTWAGMTDEFTEGAWRWYTSQTPLNYSDWQPNQSVTDVQDCGVFWKDFGYKWADDFCSDDCTPLCKQRGAVFPGIIG